MNDEEAALFAMTLAALQAAEDGGSASRGLIESAEPMTATCEVEYADSEDSDSASSVNDSSQSANREDAKA